MEGVAIGARGHPRPVTDVVTFAAEDKYSLVTLDDGKANAVSFTLLEQLNAALDKAEAAPLRLPLEIAAPQREREDGRG